MKKLCSKCTIDKHTDDFQENSNAADGLQSHCKSCQLSGVKAHKRTKKGLVTALYGQQRGNSKARGHAMPTYSKAELRHWLFSQELFHLLYDNWKRLNFQSDYRPSVDRKDESIGYTIGNIQLMTWKENRVKGHKDHNDQYANPKDIKYDADRQVECFNEYGVIKRQWPNIKSAQESIGNSQIWMAIKYGHKAGNLYWRYVSG